MSKLFIRKATEKDCELVKKLVNEMYNIEYEVRDNFEISQAIKNQTEIYFFAYSGENVAGFSGASLNNDYYKDIISPDVAVIDYIYVTQFNSDLSTPFLLINSLIKYLVEIGIKSAIMQVQTSNKQRFFHYALSNKNIIKSTPIVQHNQTYEDQILLIEDLTSVMNISMKDLMQKAYLFKHNKKV